MTSPEDTRSRIVNVRPKPGKIVALPQPDQLEPLAERLVRNAKAAASHPGLMGFAIVAWDDQGEPIEAWGIETSSDLSEHMLPAIVHDILHRAVSSAPAREEVS